MLKVIEWQNANQNRRYPFVEDSQMEVSGPATFDLPNDTLIDFRFISYTFANAPVYLHTVTLSGTSAIFKFLFDAVTPQYYTITVPTVGAFPYSGITVNMDSTLRASFGPGVKTIRDTYIDGDYVATTPIPLEPALSIFQNRHRVNSMSAADEDAFILAGNIYFREGYGININLNTTDTFLTISAEVGAGAGIPCESLLAQDQNCENGIFHINGIRPNAAGEFTFVAGAGFKIIPDNDNHRVIFQTTVDPNRPNCEDEE